MRLRNVDIYVTGSNSKMLTKLETELRPLKNAKNFFKMIAERLAMYLQEI